MKLLTGKKRKIAVLITSGLGDSLLFVPLLKELKRKQFNITCIFYTKHDNDCLFDPGLVDSKVSVTSRFSLLMYAARNFRHFSNFYINQFGKGSIIRLAAQVCSRRITQTRHNEENKGSSKRKKQVIDDLSDAEQNLHLLYSESNSKIKNISSFYLPDPQAGRRAQNNFIKEELPYFIIQVSSGNNTTPFKNWPIPNWLVLIEKLCRTYTNFEFVIVGDSTEKIYIQDFESLEHLNCKVLIGKTTVKEIFDLAAGSIGYIGLDSGIMHMAVALQKKTFTIFGASNEKLYGYGVLDPVNHKVITSNISCRPCSSWKNPNTSRVSNPMLCPDFACLSLIEPGLVFEQVTLHFGL